jgi:chromatin structure-remodeling complex protein RSC7
VIYDSKGNPQVIENDEALLSQFDEEGEKKVDMDGNLLGGREYRCRTFTVLGREDRLYMLSTEPARALGFRDSYLFFRNNPVLYKIIATEAEKADMIDRELMPPSYKGRAVGLVTARSVFKQYGAKIVVGGRRVIDDYWEANTRADPSVVEGEIADPTDTLPEEGKPYNRDRYVAWLGASSVYHQQPQSTVPQQPTLLGGRPRKKVHVTEENWISEHAWSCVHYNEALTEGRAERWSAGYYEPHVDIRFWQQTAQPSLAKWTIIDGEGDKIVVDYEMKVPPFSKSGVGIAALLDREGEEWIDDLGLDEKTKRAILHRGREERRWEAQWKRDSK